MTLVKISKRAAAWISVIALVTGVGVITVAATLERRSLLGTDPSTQDLGQKVSWRVHLFARKATGDLPELSWNDLWQMSRHEGGFGLDGMARVGLSLDGSVHNPYVTEDDHRAGARIFGERCATCHGGNGTGWQGPPLNRSGLKHGDSDLAIYTVLRDGIPASPMVAPALSLKERWQVVGYLRTLQQLHHSGRGSDETTHRDIQVSSEQILAAGSRSD